MSEKKDFITRSAELPAEALEKTIELTEDAARVLSNDRAFKKSKDYWRMLGPGLTTGASDWAQITRSKEIVMAKVIEFYIPKNFRKPLKCAPQLQCGKVIEFCSQIKKSA